MASSIYRLSLKQAISADTKKQDNRTRLKDITDRLTKDEEAAKLLKEAKDSGFKIRMCEGIGCYGSADPDKKIIYLNTDYNNGMLIGTLAHELRHIHQYGQGALPTIEYLTAKSYLMQNRAMEADAQACAVSICHNLAEQGDTQPLKEFGKDSAQIIAAFEEEKDKSGNNDNAKFAAFKAWYKNKGIIDTYDSFQADDLEGIEDYDNCTFATKLSAKKIVNMICDSGKGNYFKASPSLLEKPEFIAISEVNKKRIKDFFKDEILRDDYEIHENSIDKLPTRKDARKQVAKGRLSQQSANACQQIMLKRLFLLGLKNKN